MATEDYLAHEETPQIKVIPPDKARIWKIWKTMIILAVVTLIEFAFAFSMDAGVLRTSIFVGLTIVKAFYIVSEFMHLKYEVKVLIWSILIPTVFIVWLLLALLIEGEGIFNLRF
ncbi:MAG: cytochrome C oxidase subunit IV family protein [Cyclobacteriaceae bacterium]|nr:cytochrome C oxidase subunit IV family protein [Cyclobacteriaceae bacterium]